MLLTDIRSMDICGFFVSTQLHFRRYLTKTFIITNLNTVCYLDYKNSIVFAEKLPDAKQHRNLTASQLALSVNNNYRSVAVTVLQRRLLLHVLPVKNNQDIKGGHFTSAKTSKQLNSKNNGQIMMMVIRSWQIFRSLFVENKCTTNFLQRITFQLPLTRNKFGIYDRFPFKRFLEISTNLRYHRFAQASVFKMRF